MLIADVTENQDFAIIEQAKKIAKDVRPWNISSLKSDGKKAAARMCLDLNENMSLNQLTRTSKMIVSLNQGGIK